MSSEKRKRDDLEDLPRITYIVGDRTFERLFKETSLKDTRDVVRRKLQLPSHSTIKLKQLRNGKYIDLDDDDDFDAFYARARSVMSVDVAVDVSQTPPAANSATPPAEAGSTLESWETQLENNTNAAEPQLQEQQVGRKEPSTKSRASTATKTIDLTDGQPPKKKPKTAKAATSKDVSSMPVITKTTKKPATDSIDAQPPKKKSKTAKANTSKDAPSTKIVTELTETPSIERTDAQPPKKPETAKADTSKNAPSTQVVAEPAEKPPADPTDAQPPKKPETVKAGTSKDATSTRVVTKSTKKPSTDPIDEQPPKKKSKTAKADTSTDPIDEQPPKKKSKTAKADTSTDPIDEQPPKKKSKTAKADTSKDSTEKPLKKSSKKAGTSKDVTKPTEKLPKKSKKAVNVKESSKLPLDNDAVSAPPSSAESSGILSRVENAVAGGSSALQSSRDEPSAETHDLIAAEKTTAKSKSKDKESETQASEPATEVYLPLTKAKKVATTKAEVSKAKNTKKSKPSKAKASAPDASGPLDAHDILTIVNRIAVAQSAISPREEGKETKAKTKKINIKRNLVDTSQPSASSSPAVIKTINGGGNEAIHNKLEELKKVGTSEHQLAIKYLESLLNSSSIAVPSATNAAQQDLEIDNASEGQTTNVAEKFVSHSQPLRTPLMPSNSLLAEVTVESRDEGSSSEEEDAFDHEPEQGGYDVDVEMDQPSLDDVDLDAIIRGPTPIKLHNLISTLESKEDESETEDEDVDMDPLEVEDDDVEERKYRRLSQRIPESSEEQEDDEDGGGDDDSEQRSMPPPKQNIYNALPSSGGLKFSARPDDPISNAKETGSRTNVIPTSDSDDTRVSVSGAPDGNKDLAEDDGKSAGAQDLDKPSGTSPAGSLSPIRNEIETTNDPIEPADDLVEQGGAFDIDPIEATTPPGLKTTLPLSPVIHSTPKSGVAKRMKTRQGLYASPSQVPVRADEPEITRKAKVAARTQLSNRDGIGATRADLPRISSQPVGRSAAFVKKNGHAATPSHSQPLPRVPTSLARWDAIHEPTPSIMTDEIVPSSPPLDGLGDILGELAGKASDQNGIDTGERSDDASATSREPLFTLTASQVPFPYSQYNAPIQKRFEVVEDSSSMESEANGGVERKKRAVAKTRKSTYRKLSDIASQSALFSQSAAVLPGPSVMASRKVLQVDDSDDETSSSDSDGGNQSHIPEAKRAGKLRSKKLKGLLGLHY